MAAELRQGGFEPAVMSQRRPASSGAASDTFEAPLDASAEAVASPSCARNASALPRHPLHELQDASAADPPASLEVHPWLLNAMVAALQPAAWGRAERARLEVWQPVSEERQASLGEPKVVPLIGDARCRWERWHTCRQCREDALEAEDSPAANSARGELSEPLRSRLRCPPPRKVTKERHCPHELSLWQGCTPAIFQLGSRAHAGPWTPAILHDKLYSFLV
mmetsp:Transcript_30074/g.70101  ORF Transcript_30074/g.70101 Transcript_30074/m.70101 type:complete len:222 (-) Transcript_30074:317-982(-)